MNPIVIARTSKGTSIYGGDVHLDYVIDELKKKGMSLEVLYLDRLSCLPVKNKLLLNILTLIRLVPIIWCPGSLLITSSNYYLYLFSLPLFKFSRCQILAICHHMAFHDRRSRVARWVAKIGEKHLLNSVHRIISVSPATRAEIEKNSTNTDIIIISNGVDKSVLPEVYGNHNDQTRPFNVLFIGSCIPRKGLIYLVEAMIKLKEEDMLLNIVGNHLDDVEYYCQLRKMIKKHSMTERVVFHGPVSDEDKWSLLARSDVFVLPSLHEGHGIALTEAMCFGLPLIVTNVGLAANYIQNEVNGMTVEAGNSNQLAEVIRKLMYNKPVRTMLVQESRKLLDHFPSWDEVAEMYFQVLNKEA